MAQRKTPVTIETALKESEELLREKAEQIIQFKKLGFRQSTIDKLIYEFTISKQYYDIFKGRITDGKRGIGSRNTSRNQSN